MTLPQKHVSIPEDEWDLLEKHYKKNEKKLRQKHGVRSPTALLRYWIRQGLKETYNEGE